MSDWKADYQKALLDYVFRHGTPVEEPSRSAYGWMASDWREILTHANECSPDPVLSTKPEESGWSEFDGTFADPPWSSKHGLDAVITCKCGVIHKRRFRFQGGIGDVIAGVLQED